MVQKWTRELLVDSLVDMHRNGYKLRATVIQQQSPGIQQALYYKWDGKPKYFRDLKEVREAVAERFEQLGDQKSAEEVRKLNGKPPSPTKYSDSKREEIRLQVLEEFKRKIEAGEDVRLRALQQSDRSFESKLKRYVGYHEAFRLLGLNHADYQRHVKHTKKYYLERLIDCLRSGQDLDRTAMEISNPDLTHNLANRFSSYYRAIEEARKLLEKKEPNLAKKLDPVYWATHAKDRRKEKSILRISNALETLAVIDINRKYDSVNGFIKIEKPETGGIILERLKSAGWLTSQQVSDQIGSTQINISKNFPINFPTSCIRFQNGQKHMYLFHPSVIESYEQKNDFNSPENSANKVAKNLGVSYSKVRSVADNLGLGTRIGNYRCFSDEDIDTLKGVLEREKNMKGEIIGSIDPLKDYSLRELELMGIPISHFGRMIRSGKLPRIKKGGLMAVSGSYAREYFEEAYDEKHLSQGINLITFFNPHLYTASDLILELGIDRSTIRNRLEALIEESPDLIFSLRKSKRKKVLATEEAIPLLRDYENRSSFQLLSRLERVSPNLVPMVDAVEAISDSEKLVSLNQKIRPKDNNSGFRIYRRLNDFLKQTTQVNDETNIFLKDLYLVYNYMRVHDYSSLQIGKDYNLEGLSKLVDLGLVGKVAKSSQALGFLLYSSNSGLIKSFMARYKIPFSDSQPAEESLMRAVEKFDPDKGFQFSTFAFTAMRNAYSTIWQKRKRMPKHVSLHQTFGKNGDDELVALIDSGSEQAPEAAMESELQRRIRNLVDKLPEGGKEILVKRFGLFGEERMTLEEIGKEKKLSRERIRQLEEKALGALAKDPDVQVLFDYING